MEAEAVVFSCKEMRNNIFNYIPKRCKSCSNILSNKKIPGYPKYHNSIKWCRSESKIKHYCNWCYYYVFEYN